MIEKIVVDAFGGDNAPQEVVKGAIEAIADKTFGVALVGNKEAIENELAKYEYDKDYVEILEADEVISNDESPTEAIRKKKNSSIVVGASSLNEREDFVAYFSAGSTGANLAAAIFKIGRIKGVQRPALTVALPNAKGGETLLLDAGANVDCKPDYLYQFAQMGNIYMKMVYGIKEPKVAVLSNGTEDHKGSNLSKTAFELISGDDNINFVGNMEARDLLSGNYDVIVADGFDGNVALKSTEGAIMTVLGFLKAGIKSRFLSKIGALFMKKTFDDLKGKLDYNKKGGAVLLGISKVVVKGHGSSKAESIKMAIKQAYGLYKAGFVEEIKELLKKEIV